MKAFLIAITLLILLPTPIHADSFGLKIEPANSSLQLDQGNQQDIIYTVTNTSDYTLTITPKIYEFTPENEDSGSIKLNRTNIASTRPALANYFTFRHQGGIIQQLTLNPKESTALVLSINIPPGAVSEDIYTSVILSTQNQSENINITGAVGSNIILTVGTPQPNISITQFQSDGSIFGGERLFTLVAKNSGKSHAQISGKIEIYNMLGKKVHEVSSQQVTILGESTRKLLDDKRQPLSWEPGTIGGRYTAVATINGQEKVQTSIYFTVIPIIPILALSGSLFVIVGVYLRVKRKL